jgi:hypothetical protein
LIHRLTQLAGALALAVLIPSVGYAQASVAGIVRDASGGVLPGVTVEAASPALIEKSRDSHVQQRGTVSHRRSATGHVHRYLHLARPQHLQA